MSRIGNKLITIPAGVVVEINDNNSVVVKGPKGELQAKFNETLEIKQEGLDIKITRPNDEIFSRKIHGTTRALLNNMVVGVSTGFKKELEIQGVGYRAQVTQNQVTLSIGFSHPVVFEIPQGISVQSSKPTELVIEGIDKQLVGEFAANIRATRKPEPYLGKGIRYAGEYVRRKAGKSAK